ncbi:hypothetical protein MCUN1_002755 [Malassezia cuniculi]|uniref:Uncharacterized protein n=1 Tax=Malassezia cuniculi TaxID=948313 RepID=A0AAF0F044_9BASI|nr:hypothetical protein MCUN1_002755 [Malassezia cuniculi]
MFAPQALLARVAFVRAPEAQAPPLVERPADIHPLPDSVDAYFVYPFTAEDYVTSNTSSKQIKGLFERQDAYLAARRAQREHENAQKLARMAPGWSGEDTILEPTRLHDTAPTKGKAREEESTAALSGGIESLHIN